MRDSGDSAPTLIDCVRYGQTALDPREVSERCGRSPDGGPHEGVDGPPKYDPALHGVRRGFSLHAASCPLSDPSPWATGSPCFCGPKGGDRG